ncbi:MAG: RNA polymerase sigma factor [Bacteroidetes bacterium]|nr:MAG: RNA polymerase sigma factor [Bacteroidota bacterium]
MSLWDEPELVNLSKNGDSKAYRQLVERNMKQAYNLAYRYVGNHDDAQDVAQDAFVRAYRSLKYFRGDAGFSTWLYRIVTNVALNRVKQLQRITKHESPITETTEMLMGHEPTVMRGFDTSAHIERALHELPTLQRAVVILRHLNGLSTKQVSNILRCSEGTVKTHLHRGIKKLQLKLKFLEEEQV